MSEFVIGGYSKVVRAIIDESELPRVSCIVPFSVTNGEEAEAYKCAIQDYVSGENVKMNVLTRSMVREEKELNRCEENVGETDLWCVVTSESGSGSAPEMVQEASSQSDPLIMPEVESRVGEGHGVDEVEVVLKPDEPQAKASEATSVVESVSESDELGEGSPTPLNELSQLSGEEARLCELASEIGPVKEGSDGVEFRDELLNDESLRDWRELGERTERGFKWKRNALVRSMYVTWEQFRDVLVLPRSYRARVLELGHEKNGHLGAEKVNDMIGRYFVWLGMAKDVVSRKDRSIS